MFYRNSLNCFKDKIRQCPERCAASRTHKTQPVECTLTQVRLPQPYQARPQWNQECLRQPSLYTYPKNQQVGRWDGSNSKTSNMCHFFTQLCPEPRWSTKLLYGWAEIKVLRHEQIYRNVEWKIQQPPLPTPKKKNSVRTWRQRPKLRVEIRGSGYLRNLLFRPVRKTEKTDYLVQACPSVCRPVLMEQLASH